MRWAIALVVLTGGCAYNVNGERIPRDVYHAQTAHALLVEAIQADADFDARNPIAAIPAHCATQALTPTALSACALAMATYNAQLQIREQNRKAKAVYATQILNQQAQERMQKWNLWVNNPITSALAQRYIGGRRTGGGGGVTINGHRVGGAGCVKNATDVESGSLCGSASAGDMYVTVNQGNNNQGMSGNGTFDPTLEYATDLGATDPSFGGDVTDNRQINDQDTVGTSGGLF